MATKFRFIEY